MGYHRQDAVVFWEAECPTTRAGKESPMEISSNRPRQRQRKERVPGSVAPAALRQGKASWMAYRP